MKLEALDHPKTLDFASRLEISMPAAIGSLELLWAFVGKKSPQGNVGKWPDGAIARACYWEGKPELFVRALVDAGFLDVDQQHRLVVHDWQEHAPRWVKAKLAHMKVGFISASTPTVGPTVVGDVQETVSPTSKGREGKGSEGKGRQADARARFLDFRRAYPEGTYTDASWQYGEREYYRLADDVPHETLLLAADQYRAQQEAMGTEARYIKSPQKFLAEGHWRGPFPMPKSKAETQQDANIAAGLQWLKESESAA